MTQLMSAHPKSWTISRIGSTNDKIISTLALVVQVPGSIRFQDKKKLVLAICQWPSVIPQSLSRQLLTWWGSPLTRNSMGPSMLTQLQAHFLTLRVPIPMLPPSPTMLPNLLCKAVHHQWVKITKPYPNPITTGSVHISGKGPEPPYKGNVGTL